MNSHVKLYWSGQGQAVADILFGEANSCGKFAETFPMCPEENPTYPYFPVYNDEVVYHEGLIVGYRYYDTLYSDNRYHDIIKTFYETMGMDEHNPMFPIFGSIILSSLPGLLTFFQIPIEEGTRIMNGIIAQIEERSNGLQDGRCVQQLMYSFTVLHYLEEGRTDKGKDEVFCLLNPALSRDTSSGSGTLS